MKQANKTTQIEKKRQANFEDTINWWATLYQNQLNIKIDATTIALPQKCTEFGMPVLVPKIMTRNKAVALCREYFPVHFGLGVDLGRISDERQPSIIGNYLTLFKERNEPDAKYLGKTHLAITDKANGCTLTERLLLELKYFIMSEGRATKQECKTKKKDCLLAMRHLDKSCVTWCKGSKIEDGLVCIYWHSGSIYICFFDKNHAYPKMGIREICPPILQKAA